MTASERGLVILSDRTAARADEWCIALESAGFLVEIQTDAVRALDRARAALPVAVVVHWAHRHDAWLSTMRLQCDEGLPTRFLVLIPRGDDDACERCISAGADAVADRDCSGPELAARVEALVRRPPRGASTTVDRSIRLGDLVIDPAAQVVWRGAVRLRLSAREFALLLALVRARGRVVTRDEIYNEVWHSRTSATSRAIDTCVATLRRKLESGAGPRLYIHTVHSIGYMVSTDHGGSE